MSTKLKLGVDGVYTQEEDNYSLPQKEPNKPGTKTKIPQHIKKLFKKLLNRDAL